MNKKLIRLTESDLHKIVRESVNRILSEQLPGIYTGRDFTMNHPEGKYSLHYNKEMANRSRSDSVNRGEMPKPFAGWSKRVNDGKGNYSSADFDPNDMYMFDDDAASDTAYNLRQYDPDYQCHWDMFRKGNAKNSAKLRQPQVQS